MKKILAVLAVVIFVVVLFVVSIVGDEGTQCDAPGGGGGSSVNVEGGLAEPIADFTDSMITSVFHEDRGYAHKGIDIGAPMDTPMYALASGTVLKSEPASGFGNWIVIESQIDGRRMDHVYGHMKAENLLVKEGDQVSTGQMISKVGSEGGSSGPHLHIELWDGGRFDMPGGQNGTEIDPTPYVQKAATGEKKGGEGPRIIGGESSGSGSSGSDSAASSAKKSSSRLVVIGDSTTVGVKDALAGELAAKKAYDDVEIDAVGGSAILEATNGTTGMDRIRAQKSGGKSDWFIGMGVNDTGNASFAGEGIKANAQRRVTAVMDELGDQGTVWWPTVDVAESADSPFNTANVNQFNAGLAEAAEKYPNLHIVKWSPPDSAYGGDGIHYSSSGNEQRTQMIVTTVTRGADAGSAVAASDGDGDAAGDSGDTASGGDLPPSDKIANEDHLQVDTIRVARAVAQKFPELETIGGWRPVDNYPDHPSGRAADIMIPDYDTDKGRQLGDSIKDYLFENREDFHIEYMIWRQQYIPSEGTGNTMEDRGSPTQNHFDHVHVTTVGGGMPTEGQTYSAAPGGGGSSSDSDDCVDDEHASGVDVGLNAAEIPEDWVKWIKLAGRLCKEVPAPLLAAQLQQESGFRTNIGSPAGAQGPAQFMPGTWATYGYDVDDQGEKRGAAGGGDINDPADAIMAQGRLMCENAQTARSKLDSGTWSGDATELALASYNAGQGNVDAYGGVPPFAETQKYVKIIPANAKNFEEKV